MAPTRSRRPPRTGRPACSATTTVTYQHRRADDHQEGGVGDARATSRRSTGRTDPELTTTDSGFLAADLGADKIAFSASRAAGESVAGSPYTITPAASDGATSLLGNYDVTDNTGELTITKKAASVTRGRQVEGLRVGRSGADDDRQRLPGRRSGRRQDRLQRLARCRRVGRGWPLHDHPGRLGRGDQPARQLRRHLQHRRADDHQEGGVGDARATSRRSTGRTIRR